MITIFASPGSALLGTAILSFVNSFSGSVGATSGSYLTQKVIKGYEERSKKKEAPQPKEKDEVKPPKSDKDPEEPKGPCSCGQCKCGLQDS